FDINDFDETLPGPWEWDVKRLAASFVHASRSNGFAAGDQRDAAQACVRSYREHIAKYARMRSLDGWDSRIDLEAIIAALSDSVTARRLRKRLAKTAAHSVPESDFPKMVEGKAGRFAIKDSPPLIYHDASVNLATDRENVLGAFDAYRKSLQEDRRV